MNLFEYFQKLKGKEFHGQILVKFAKGQIEEVQQTHKIRGEITKIPAEQDKKTEPS